MKKGLKAFLIIFLVLLVLGGAAYGAHYWAGLPEILSLSDEGPFEVEYGSEFALPAAEGKYNLTEVAREGEIDTLKLGTQTVTYRYLRVEKTVTVTVVDTVRPVLKLLGDAEMSLRTVDTFEEPGFTAWDNVDGDITDKVEITSDLDITTEGFYTITYEVRDSSGNRIRERRQIAVTKYDPLSQSMTEFDLTPLFPDVILPYSETPNTENFKNCVFFGDSIIGNLGFIASLPINKNFWTRSSMTTDNVYTRVINIGGQKQSNFVAELEKRQPETVLILMNTAESGSWSTEYFVSSWELAIQKFREVAPNTRFIIMSNLPVAANGDLDAYKRTAKTNTLNYYLCELCRKYGLYFMNAAEALKNEEGIGRSDYFMDDAIHPNTPGSEAIIEYIKTHLNY